MEQEGQEWEQVGQEYQGPTKEQIAEVIRRQQAERQRLKPINIDIKSYLSQLGIKISDHKVDDVISGETMNIDKYLEEDPDNCAIMVINKRGPPIIFSTSATQVSNNLGVYECLGRWNFGDRYMLLSGLGCPCVGMVSYEPVKFLLDKGMRFFVVRETQQKSRSLMGHEQRYMGATYVGTYHCQKGSERSYYQVHIPEEMLSMEQEPWYEPFTLRDQISYPSVRGKSSGLPTWLYGLNEDDILQSAIDGDTRAMIYCINILQYPEQFMLELLNTDDLRYLIKLAPPHSYSKMKTKYREVLDNKIIDSCKTYRTPWIKPKVNEVETVFYETMTGWMGEIMEVAKFPLPLLLRAIWLLNDVLRKHSITRENYQLVICAVLFIAEIIESPETDNGMRFNEKDLVQLALNEYSVYEIESMVAAICATKPDVMFMDIPIDHIPEDDRQHYIYSKQYLRNPNKIPAIDKIKRFDDLSIIPKKW